MYQLLLTLKYLTHKVMPLLAALAVMLCTAMVLIVWSVMGGFLTLFLESGKTLIGDVIISYPANGFAHYPDLIKRLESDPAIEAAAPMIESFGILKLPYAMSPKTVMLRGIEGESFNRVVNYNKSLWWKPITTPMPTDKKSQDYRLDTGRHARLKELEQQGQTLSAPRNADPTDLRPAMVLGIEVGGYNERQPGGFFEPIYFLPGSKATLTVASIDSRGYPRTPKSSIIPIANQFQSGLYELDASVAMIRLDELQKLLYMDAAYEVQRDSSGNYIYEKDPATGELKPVEVPTPARVTTVLVKGKPGAKLEDVLARSRAIYTDFAAAHSGDISPPPPLDSSLEIETWKDRNATMIGAIETEIALVLVLFGIISLTAVFMVLAIFWAMVSEKTKDIGVLRAIGASRSGVAGVWLTYGLTIGIVGSLLGGVAAILIVNNINPIHDWLGRQLGIVVWNPKVYYFTQIPSKIDAFHATLVLVGGVLSSVAGALIPALKAAHMDPVKSLRFE